MINDIIQLLGAANPQLSVNRTHGSSAASLTYVGSFSFIFPDNTDGFVAPIAGFLSRNAVLERIVLPGGGSPNSGTIVLKMDPQAYLRIGRLYATIIEGRNVNTHLTERPVPCYFVYSGFTGLPWKDEDQPPDRKTGCTWPAAICCWPAAC